MTKIGKHPVNHRGAGGKKYDSFQPVMNLIFFPPVEDNLVSTELSPVKGVNSVLTKIVLNLLAVIALTACSIQDESIYHDQFITFGTVVNLTISGATPEQTRAASQQINTEFQKLHNEWHAWETGGILHKINSTIAKNQTITVNSEVAGLLRKSKQLSKQSNQLFNPAVGKLVKLWGFHSNNWQGPPPSKELIEETVALQPSMENISISDNNEVSSSNPDVSLDLGAIAKGYAVDRAVAVLHKLGIKNAIINTGGDLRAIGKKTNSNWQIGIRHPRSSGTLAAIEINGDESIFTSGDYERYFIHNNTRYHHIINPKSGYPAYQLQSVTVLHQQATVADAGATAVLLSGDKWREIAKKMQLNHVLVVTKTGKIEMTNAMKNRVKIWDK